MCSLMLHSCDILLFLPHSFNRLSAASFDEASFAHLTQLQVLDVGQGNPDLFSQRKETEGGALTQEEEEEEEN